MGFFRVSSYGHSNILQAQGEGDVITRERLDKLKNDLLAFNRIRTVSAFPGLKPERQTIFPAGLAILTRLL